MTVYDLNSDQLTELKQRYYAEQTGRDLSYEELANIDFYVTDYDVQHEYDAVDFVNDDFFCSAGEPDAVSLTVDATGDKYDIANDLRQIARDIENGYYSGIANYGASWSIE